MAWMPILLLGIAAMLTAILVLRLPKQGWMLFAAVLIFGLAGYGTFGSPRKPAAPKAAGAEQMRSGEQLVQARRSLFDDGSPPPSHLVTSDGYARQGRYEEAAGFLRNAIKDYPNDAETWLALAIALVEHAEGQVTPPAIVAFSKAQEAFPEHPGAGYYWVWRFCDQDSQKMRGACGPNCWSAARKMRPGGKIWSFAWPDWTS